MKPTPTTDRAAAENHLVLAEQHVTKGQRHIEQQRELVAELQRDGRDATKAQDLLRSYEHSHSLNVAQRVMQSYFPQKRTL